MTLGTSASNNLDAYGPNTAATLTIGSGITVQGGSGTVGGYYSADSVVNDGTIQADLSGGTITVEGSAVAFLNSGTVNASLGAINISTGSAGTVNSGTLSAGPTGTLAITGPYTQSAAGTLNEVIGGATTGLYGKTSISGTASLGGSLDVNLINGYTPQQGASFPILTFASETGNFSAENGLYFGGGEAFNPTFSPSTNPTALDLVVIPESAGTQTTVQSSENPSNYGDSVAFTATVAPTVSTYLVPTGQVTFYEGSTAVDTTTLVNGSATYVVSTLAAGTYAITAQYSGDPNFSGSTSTALTQTVDPGGSQTALQSSEDPSNYGDPVAFTATVSPTSSASGLATPTGKVEFFDGSTLLDTATLSGGTASYTTSSLPLGANQEIEAKYLGDTNYNPSNFTIPQTVNTPPLTDFWTGASAAHGGNDNWSNPGNWALGAPPTAAETAYFTASESQYSTSNVDTSFSIANLTIDSSWGGSIGVSASLTVSGNLILASGTLGGSAAISVGGSGSQFSGGTLNAGSGGFTNSGTLTWAGGTLNGTFTNDADGIIQVTAGTGGTRSITGNLTNLGAIDVGAGTTLAVNNTSTAATFLNEGQVTVDPAGFMFVSQTYNAAGGTITGPGYVYNGTLRVTVSTASPLTILVDGTTTLATNNLPNTTIWVQGDGYLGGVNATLTVAAGLTNDGTILLESQNSTYSDTLSTGSGGFTNAADGIIQVTAGTGGTRSINGNLTNLGAIDVGAGTTLAVNNTSTAATFLNEGQVTVDPAGFMFVSQTYNAAGGTITGPGYVYNGTLRVTVSTASPLTILVNGTTTLATNNLPNTTIWVQGDGYLGGVNATLTVAAGLTNDGTILLESQNSTYSDTLSTGSGGFTNAADGIIQVTAGTGGTRSITGNLTNLGAIDVGAGTTLAVNNSSTAATFLNEGQVTVNPAGFMFVSQTYNAAGGTITGPGYVYNGTLRVTVSTASPLTILVDGTTTLATNNLPNTTIWVQGDGYLGGVNATLTVAAGLTNDGTILLESQNSTYSDTLSTGSGGFTNAADGIIQVTAGTGGTRSINGNLTNLGAIDVGAGTTLAVNNTSTAATFLNEGQVTVNPAGFMFVSQTYNAAGGTITGPGYVYNGTLLVTVSTASPLTILVDGTTTLATNNLPNTTIWVQGDGYLGGVNATLTVAAGLTNDGTILLESQNSTYSDTLSTGSGGLTNAADGIIQVTAGTGGTRSINGNLTNLGAIDVGAGTTLAVNNTSTAATFLNEGQVTVNPAGFMFVSQTYNAAGGTITGPGYVYNGTLRVTVSTASPLTILVNGTTTLATNNLPNTTIWVQGDGYLGGVNATLTVPAGLTNDGTILLESQNSTYSDTLSTGSGGFTNAADGIIQVTAGTGGTRSINGNLTNLGTITVGAGTTLAVNNTSTAATFLNEGQVTVNPAGFMFVSQTYNAAGGTITGPGYVYNGTLLVTVSTASPLTILVNGTTTLATNNLPNTTIWVQGDGYLGGVNATLTVAAGLTNDGTILLESQNSTYSDTLSIGSGTFTNAAGGIITVVAGTGGTRSISGAITNAGTINFDTNTTFGVAGANLTNTGLMSIAAATVTVVGSTFTNGVGGLVSGYGTFNTSGVTLNDTGGTMQALGGTLNLTNSGLVSSGTLGVGTWVVGPNSTLTISGVTSITTLSANVTLEGSGATFTGISSLSKITAAGELELQNGAFTTAANLDNAGTIDLAPGTLNVAGTYTQESTGAYDVAIGGITPGSSFGQLNVSQSALLNGSLSVNLINNYAPPQGDSYQVLTFASETGNFSAEFGLYLGGGEGFSPTFSPSTNPTALDLAVISESAGTQTTVQSSENPSNYGDAVTFTATVAPSVSTDLVPTGQVTFYEGSTAVDTATLVNGAATYVSSTLAGGTYSITVQYGGDSNFSGSTSTALTQTVNPIASQTGLQSSEDPSNYGDSVTFTASISPTSSASGLATPTGQVEFYDGSTLLDTATLNGGTASYTTSSLPLGANQQIEAKYLGDTNYNPSNFTIPQTVNTPPLTDFWTGASAAHGGNDDWSNSGNWALGAPPTAAETAYFTASESQYSTSIVDTSFSIANLTIDSSWGGTVSASGSLTISGNLILASGTLGGSGAISVAGSGSQFSGGTLSGNLANAGTLTLGSSGMVFLTGTITNTGTIDVTGTGTVAITGTIDGGTVDAGTGTNLVLAGSTLSGVTVDGNFAVSGNGGVTVQNGLTLNGTATLGAASSNLYGYLNFMGSQTLSGSGTVVFGQDSPNTLLVGQADTTLTIGSGITVRGQSGAVGYNPSLGLGTSNAAVVNQGTIQADVAGGTITVYGTGGQNTGTLTALNGGTISLQGTGWLDSGVNYADASSAFSITASLSNSGNTLALSGPGTFSSSGSIQGGTISVTGATPLKLSGTVDGVTVDGNFAVSGNSSVTVQDGLTLNGTATLGAASSNLYGYLNFMGSQTLSGSGTVVFGQDSPNTLLVGQADTTLTIGSGITVRGQSGAVGYNPSLGLGTSNAAVVNQGTIQADVAGGTITVYGAGGQNTGTLTALNGGTISLQGTGWLDSGVNYADASSAFSVDGSFSNTGNTLSLAGPGTFSGNVSVQGGVVSVSAGNSLSLTGGTFGNTTINGDLKVTGACTFDGITMDGNLAITGNSGVTVQGGLTLDGAATLGAASSNLYGYLNFTGSQTLSGTGTVVFGQDSPNTLLVGQADTTLTIGSGITVRGQSGAVGYNPSLGLGTSNAAVVNEGTIQADVAGGTITVYGTGGQNTGTLTALNGGTISLQGTGWLDSGVNYADASSAFSITASLSNSGNTLALSGPGTFSSSGSIQGGTISVTGATPLKLSGTVDGVTVNGNFAVSGNGGVTVQNGLTLNGTATLGAASSNLYGYLNFMGSQTLSGSGTVVFGQDSPNTLLVGQADTTLTIGSGITVRGQSGAVGYNPSLGLGTSNAAVVNQGTIQADVAGGTITVYGTNDQNAGSLNALNGATLSIQGTLTNMATVSVDATSVLSLSGTLTGGMIDTQTGAQIRGSTLNGATIDGNFTVSGDNSVTVQNGLTLNGTATLGAASSNLYGYLNFMGSETLSGTGTVVFGQDSPNTLLVGQAGTTLTIGSGITVRGQSGAVGYNPSLGLGTSNAAVVNQGTIQADVSGGTITIGVTWTNDGSVEATDGGMLSASTPENLSAGTLSGGTWILGPNGTLSLGESVTTDAATIIVTGAGGRFSGSSPLSAISAAGSLEVLDGATFTIAGNLDNAGTIDLAPGTLDVTGTYTQESTGAYDVAIGGITPGSSFGQLNVSQSASLNGSLSVNLINNYAPPQGDSYQVLAFASETGNFSAEFGLYFGGGEGFSPTFIPSTNPTALDLTVISESAGTQTTVQSSENPSNYGDTVTFTATVAPSVSTDLVPTGQVTFYEGSTAVDTETLVNGSAAYVPATLAGGTYSITVQYSGDSNFSGSNSTALAQTVDPIASQTALQSSDNPSSFGVPVTFTATVSSSVSGLATPTGEVEFFDGSTLLGTETLSGGTASYTTSSLSVGANQPIEAEYLGDSDYSPSNLTIQQTINAPTTIMWNTTTAPTGGDWDTPGNWVGGVVPTASNNVVINLASSGTITHSTDASDAVLSLTTNGNTALNIGSGSIALGNGSSTLASVTISAGASLSVGSGASVQIPEGETLTDDGTLSFASGDTLTLGSACCSAAEIVVAGTLTAAGTTFTGISESGTIVVNSGGIITPTGSTFNVPLFVPYNDVASLAAGSNVSFDQIEISAATLPSGSELDLDLIGTDTANLNYLFPNGFTVGSGGDLVVGAGVPRPDPGGRDAHRRRHAELRQRRHPDAGLRLLLGRRDRRRRDPDRRRDHLHRHQRERHHRGQLRRHHHAHRQHVQRAPLRPVQRCRLPGGRHQCELRPDRDQRGHPPQW